MIPDSAPTLEALVPGNTASGGKMRKLRHCEEKRVNHSGTSIFFPREEPCNHVTFSRPFASRTPRKGEKCTSSPFLGFPHADVCTRSGQRVSLPHSPSQPSQSPFQLSETFPLRTACHVRHPPDGTAPCPLLDVMGLVLLFCCYFFNV